MPRKSTSTQTSEATKKVTIKKVTEPVVEEKVANPSTELLSEEEYEKRRRLKTKERINKVLRIAGLIAVIVLVYGGLIDWLFEISWFGWIWDKIAGTNQYSTAWAVLSGNYDVLIKTVVDENEVITSVETYTLSVFDNNLWFGVWLAQLGCTLLLIAIILLAVYLITYYIVDVIQIFRNFYFTTKRTVKDLGGNIKDTASIEGLQLSPLKKKKSKTVESVVADTVTQPKTKEKSLFTEEEQKELADKVKKSEEVTGASKKRRKEKPVTNETELDEETLDRLLSGESITDITKDIATETNEQ